MIRTTIVVAAGLALAALLSAAPAHALRARVFVAKTGADAGACSFSAPCQSLDFALNGVEPGGEITILDSAGYNPITITKGVTITVPPGVEAGIVPSPGGNAITILLTSPATVTLRGLTLEGAGTGSTGVDFLATAGGTLEIIDCMVKDFTANGIFVPSLTNSAKIIISHTTVLNNTGDGIQMNGINSSAFIDNTIADNNSANGINLNTEGIVELSNLHVYANNVGINITNATGVVKNSEANANQTDLALNGNLGAITLANNNAFVFVNIANNGTAFSDNTNLIIQLTGSFHHTALQ